MSMPFFTKEESRISIMSILVALFGTVIGGCIGLLGNHMNFSENRKVQTEANRRLAYTQFVGERTKLLLLFQQRLAASDKNTFYQFRAWQVAVAAKPQGHFWPKMKTPNDRQAYLSDAMQQERNAEHYDDEIVDCSEKIFESLGLAQIAFRSDQKLDDKIIAIGNALTTSHDMLPLESIAERAAWVMSTTDAEKEISERQRRKIVYIQQAIQPLADLLTDLKSELNSGS